MKQILIIFASIFCLAIPHTAIAALPVVDGGLIATNLTNAKRDLLEQLLQETNQQTQINQLLAQIRQVDDFLKRLGKLEDVRELPGFKREAEVFLRRLELNLPSFEIVRDIKKDELFEQKKDSPYGTINKNIIIDGKKVSEVDSSTVLPEMAARRTIAHYQRVRSEVLVKRSHLKGELENAMNRLQAATTTAEVQKLTAVINALNIQISATDSDMRFAATEVQTRYYQNLIEENVQRKVRVQKDRASIKEGMTKHFQFFRLPSKPALFKSNK